MVWPPMPVGTTHLGHAKEERADSSRFAFLVVARREPLGSDGVIGRDRVLDCPECKQVYVYAKVPTERFSDAGNNPFVWPLKPVPLEGLSFECPNCKKTSIYTRSDLRYRSY